MVSVKVSLQDALKAQMAIEDDRLVARFLDQVATDVWSIDADRVVPEYEDGDPLALAMESVEDLFSRSGVESYEFV